MFTKMEEEEGPMELYSFVDGDQDACPVCTNIYQGVKKIKKTKNGNDTIVNIKTVDDICIVKDCGKKCIFGSDCCGKHNTHRQKIVCTSCNNHACRVCCITYFRDCMQKNGEPSCMHCDKSFDLEFLLGLGEDGKQRFTREYVWGQLKELREKYLVEKLMVKMPMYQRIASIRNEMLYIKNENTKLENEIIRLKGIIRTNNRLIYEKQTEVSTITLGKETVKNPVSFATRGRCPAENCKGYIEDKWECGLCKTKVCSSCMKEKKEDHECSQEDVESVELIRKDTKPCPKCRTRIFRIEGCYQMFCTNCHIFFNWNTGLEIVRTQWVHNPHFTEWQRENGGAANNDQGDHNNDGCFIVNHNHIRVIFPNTISTRYGNDKHMFNYDDYKLLLNYIRKYNHIMDYINNQEDLSVIKNRDISLKYLNNELTKDDLSKHIQKYYKAARKEELANIRRRTYAEGIMDVCAMNYNKIKNKIDMNNRYRGSADFISDIESWVKKLKEWDIIVDNVMADLGKLFNNSPPLKSPGFIDQT